MNGTKKLCIGYLGEDVKMHYFDAGTVLVAFDWLNEVYINKTTNEKISQSGIT
jgi:single-strand DNA-binding protein